MNTRAEGIRGDEWQLDETLRQKATLIVDRYSELVGHVDLRNVVFVRGENLRGPGWKNTFGKCFYTPPPANMLAHWGIMVLRMAGGVDADIMNSVEDEIFDIKYIIAVNDDLLEGSEEMEEAVLLHELMHIKEDMDGIQRHDIQDFAAVLDTFGVHYTSGIFKGGGTTLEESE